MTHVDELKVLIENNKELLNEIEERKHFLDKGIFSEVSPYDIVNFTYSKYSLDLPYYVKIRLLTLRGRAQYFNNELFLAEGTLKNAYEMATEDYGEPSTIRYITIPYLNFLGRISSWRKHKEVVDEIGGYFNDSLSDQFLITHYKASSESHLDTLKRAIDSFLKCKEMGEEIKEKNIQTEEYTIHLCTIDSNIAEIYVKLLEFDTALEYFESAIRLFDEDTPSNTAAYIYKDRIKCLVLMEKYDEAEKLLADLERRLKKNGVLDAKLHSQIIDMKVTIPFFKEGNLPQDYLDRKREFLIYLNQ